MPQNYVIREDRPPRDYVPPQGPKPEIEPPGDITRLRFFHGLGDAALFAHALTLWTKRGYPIGIACEPSKEPLFRAAGCQIVPTGTVHHYSHPPGISRDTCDWTHNKVAHNLRAPLPYIGDVADLWPELLEVQLSLEKYVTADDVDEVERFLSTLPDGPLVLLHTQGNTSAGKNTPPGIDQEITYQLIRQTDATVLLLDFDQRVGKVASHRVRHLGDDWHNLSLTELWCLMERADLFIGVDSGPLHFTRFTKIPVLGLWFGHFPSHFALPHHRAAHIVTGDANFYHHHPRERIHKRRIGFNLIDALPTGEVVAANAAKVLNGIVGADLTLSHLVGKTRIPTERGVCRDRDKTFRTVFNFLRSRSNPTILETGCIRSDEDYSAGYSTYLFGIYLNRHGGHLHSVDLSTKNCEFARYRTDGLPVTVHESDSVKFLEGFEGKADLIYLDSLDSDQEGHAEHGLAEARLALNIVHDDGMILIDDSPYAGGYTGKGRLSIPFLMSQGWKVHPSSGYQAVLSKEDHRQFRLTEAHLY